MKTLLLLCGSLIASSLIFAQTGVDLNAELPLDPKIKYGKLENGITYYVMHNEEPKDRASFYIVQNVGAILENDDQNGLAHFLEHMAFNGTENFPDKRILEYLESYGVAFGRNINAYTSIDETVYNLSNVPTSNENLIDSTLLVLHDWSNYLTLSSEEIDKERGVIREEWRTRRSGSMRVYYETRKYLYKGSKYAERDVIGDTNVINNFDHRVIRNFYHDYYRTDLQAIIVVGDLDADAIVEKIKDKFSEIPAVENPKPRVYFEVPGNKEPIVGIVTDPEESAIRFSLYFKHPATSFNNKNVEYYKNMVLSSLYSEMIGNRYSELVQKGNPPFISADAVYYNNVRLMDVYNVISLLKEDNLLGGIEATMKENERVLRYGFTKGELERAKVSMLSSYETAFKERNKRENDRYVSELQNHYLKNDPVPGIEYEYDLIQKLLPGVKLSEINKLAKKWNTPENLVITLSGPEKEGLEYPSEAKILGVLAKIKQKSVEPYVDEVSDKPLISEMPKVASILVDKQLDDFNAVELELENGAKVILKNTEFKENEIRLSAYSNGGTSLCEVSDLPSAQMIGTFMSAFGLGEFDNIALGKMLNGKVVSISPYLSELYEGFSGSSSVKDFEVMLQLLYLYFENPRFDEEAFNALKQRYLAYVANMNKDVNRAFSDSVSLAITDYSERTILVGTEMIEALNFESMKRIYKDRFADAGDFTFVLVGNIDIEKAKPLVAKYIGSIKSIKRNDTWRDTKVDYPKKDTYKSFAKEMETPKTTIYINLHGKGIEYTAENRIYMSVISKLLDKKYLDVIREDEGGSYGVSVSAGINKYPKEEYSLRIKFDTDPEKAKKLMGIVYTEIDKLANGEINEVDLDEAKKNIIKVREESLRKNGYWMNAFLHYYKYNENIILPSALEDIVANVTIEKVKEFAKNNLTKTGKVEVVMTPAEM